MENFQLFRTNILLSGQVKWDLILDSKKTGGLMVKDFHLSPVSQSTPYNKLPDESLLNYSHQENLKKFYKSIESKFFDPCIDPQLKHNWIVLGDNQGIIYEDSFEAGSRNSKYSIYKKPIEIFCPVWLEQVKDSISFVIEVYTKSKRIITKSIDVMSGDFGKYLNSYIDYLGLRTGVEDVLDIDLKNKTTLITGISLDSGNIVKREVPGLTYNLLYRERTMLEFDSMLINNFSNNKLVTRQLFNFCFYVDLNDLIASNISKMMYGEELLFKIKTIVDGEELQLRDFYSNYEYIEREDISIKSIPDIINSEEKNNPLPEKNVLNYLMDYKYTNHILKNKYVQNTVHWSLNDNKDYLFNIYNGFGPYDSGYKHSYPHRYGKTPDLLSSEYRQTLNNIGWCNPLLISDSNDWLKFIYDIDYYEKIREFSTNFHPKWVNNVLYNISTTNYFKWDELRIAIFIIDDSDGDSIFNSIKSSIKSGMFSDSIQLNEGLYYIRFKSTDEFIGLVVKSSQLDCVTFRSFYGLLNTISNENPKHKVNDSSHPLYYIRNKMGSVKQIPLIAINKSLYIVNSPSPSIYTDEVEYYKDDNTSIGDCYVLRYDGKIKPTFISSEESINKNLKYYKEITSEKEYLNSNFAKYAQTSYSPVFPSIGYCAMLKKNQDMDSWERFIPILNPEMNVILYSKFDKNGNLIKIEDIIKEYLSQIYPNLDANLIYNMYNIEIFYDYKSPYNIKDYQYKIKMILK